MNPKYSEFIVPFFSSSDVIFFVPLYQCWPLTCFVHVFKVNVLSYYGSCKCPCTCILTAIINISNKIGSILTNCMSNECIHVHTHSNLEKSGIWSIDCEIWDMGYWGVKNLGYGILGVKNLGYGILGGKKSGIWDMGTPVSPPPLIRD